ncbi:CopG family ribbon-helix-helix protein [Thermomonas aquatica]|uniref:Ribbon-helix-helix protein, CopG family n=1 Tax=Thermomonas aquatica TaxID=2202149 RepID=A0A5B7ZMI4_9GAMM|nr:ribbon-helix-helix protein, CopG family [Thermomonas aquatica]QDA56504.1 ribbon-helix-helix protein, CopG family [Thermomonas aquatica]
MTVTTVRLQPEVESGLEAMADKLHRSKNWLVNQAIREFVARQELELSRWNETLTAMSSVAQGKVVSGQAVHAWLESWGNANELPPPKVGQ